jgi:para-nitrobenzyl esterase
MTKNVFSIVAAFSGFVFLSILLVGCGNSRDGTPNLVNTTSGPVKGFVDKEARVFLGIPYAAPPTGLNRWRSPQPVSPWSATRDATKSGPECSQPGPGFDENCLTLDVYAPVAAPTSPLPVMVRIHGGWFFVGGAGGYDGRQLVNAGNVVVVIINYRLGPLGFLALPELTAESATHPSSGNYGFEDQQAALRWVKDNIGNFGGDPGNVTLFGESAGGYSVCTHLLAPGSSGLFQKAISESGWCSGYTAETIDTAYGQGKVFADVLGCPPDDRVVDCLRGKTAEELSMAGESALPEPGGIYFQGPFRTDGNGVAQVPPVWRPVVDQDIVPAGAGSVGPGAAMIPLLLGTNSDEGSIFLTPNPLNGVPVANATEYQEALERRFGTNVGDQILAAYPVSAFTSANAALNAVTTDGLFACPARRTARAQAAAGADVYLYAFEHPPEEPIEPGLGVFHIAEVSFVFGVDDGLVTLQPDERPLVDTIQGYWTRFAATGDPNGGSAVSWPKYKATDDASIALNLTTTTRTGYKMATCDFWDALPAP